ncbi:LysR family transcriptional regulator [Variovorax sp. PBL-E5]|uniref:LysR family transcriptional regulator n=1 Tax=Variovorax sp. PBL-E5 TaxID=434014 RepID=UPI0013173BA8|nr:LysR substrate-binding domain-containing protein [Variovorax sp. PBL-E5]VTU36915.1 HTH-type transcriptional activator CmpR [Variovorax sp. PBL-E5]
MRLRHLEVVNAIRVTGTLSGAARLLHMTQPAVTQILQSAEKQLGYQLYRRVRGRLEPSAEAAVIFPELETLDRQIVKLQQLTSNLRSGEASLLRVLCAPALAQAVMPEIIDRFLKQHARARLSVRAEYSSSVISDLALREADIGLVFEGEQHPAIDFTALAEIPLVAVGSSKFFGTGARLGLRDVLAMPFIAPDPVDPIGRMLAKACEEHGWTLESSVSVLLYQAALATAATGLGVTIVDALTAFTADPRLLLQVAEITPALTLRVGVARAATNRQSGLADDFIGLCRRVLSERGMALG